MIIENELPDLNNDEEQEYSYCSICSEENGEHAFTCPNNLDPFATLCREGYD